MGSARGSSILEERLDKKQPPPEGGGGVASLLKHPVGAEQGFDVDVYIASSSDCGEEYDMMIKEVYSPYVLPFYFSLYCTII